MNKIISIILLCCLLLTCLSSCALTDKIFGNNDSEPEKPEVTPPENPGGTESETPENTEQVTPGEEENKTPNNEEENKTPDNTGNGTPDDIEDKTPVELQATNGLVVALIEYLRGLNADYDLPATSTGIKIDQIKGGKQALHVGLDNSEYYFVCAYYNASHSYETQNYCCATDYTWVKFKNADEISEKYNDLDFFVGFQINSPSFVTDILNEDASVPPFEHFKIYTPNFSDGLNTNEAIEFGASFIYINLLDYEKIYYSLSVYYTVLVMLPTISLDGQYYVLVSEIKIIYPDGREYVNNSVNEFGYYYDALVSVMDTESFSITDNKGKTYFYGLVALDDFVSCVNE